MIVLDVALKTLKEQVRQPRNLGLVLGLPVAFMVIFGLAFGAGAATTYKVAYVDDDGGELATAYREGLEGLEYDGGKPMLDLRPYGDAEAAAEELRARRVDLVVHVPAGFSDDLQPTVTPGASGPLPGQQPAQVAPPEGAVVALLTDPGNANSHAARALLDAYTQAFAAQASGQEPVARTDAAAVTDVELTQFDFIAPGLMVYAVLSLAPQAASALARETELRTLDRIRLSPTRASGLLAGVALAELVMACVTVTLMLLAARAMGFHNQGGYADAFAVALVAALAVVGVGMVIASFARTQQEAANLGILVSVPASFLSGAFFPVPGVTLFHWGERAVGLYDALPTKHAVEAMRQVTTFGHTLADAGAALAAMAALGALYFAAGVLLYRRARLSA